MNAVELDGLYALQQEAEVLRAIVDDEAVDRFSLVTRELEALLGDGVRDEPWFSALAPIRKARWRLHTLPLPSDHRSMGLAELHDRAVETVRRLAEGGSEELGHWAFDSLESLHELATTSNDSLASAIAEMLGDGADPTATVLVSDTGSVPAVYGFFSKSERPLAAVLTPATLRAYPSHASQLVVGASRNFPDWVFTAPRAALVTVVQRASARDRSSVDSMLPAGGLPPVAIGGQRMKRLRAEAFAIEPPPINWDSVRPQNDRGAEAQSVRARTFLLASNRSVLLEDGNEATVFTVNPGASSSELIARVPASTVDAGDYVLLRQRWGDDDTIIQLADQILGGRCRTLRAQQRRWKDSLRQAVRRDGLYRAQRKLDELGCDADNLDRWLAPDGIRTRRLNDFLMVCSYADIAESEARSIWADMGEIRSAHVKAGHRLRELLEAQLEGADLAPLEAGGYLEVRLPDLDAGMLAVYRVEARDSATVLVHPRRLRIAVPAGRL